MPESPQIVSMTLDEYFEKQELERGLITITGEIDETQSDFFLRRLRWVVYNKQALGITSITIIINSPGGSVYDALAIYDAIKLVSAHVDTIGIASGLSASAALMVVMQACTHRVTQISTRFLLHEVSSWSYGEESTAAKSRDTSRELEQVENYIIEILAKRSKKTADELRSAINGHDVWLSAEQAVEWGLIDGYSI